MQLLLILILLRSIVPLLRSANNRLSWIVRCCACWRRKGTPSFSSRAFKTRSVFSELVSVTCLFAPPSTSVPISGACRPRKEELLLQLLLLWWSSPTSRGRSSSYSTANTRNLLLLLHCCASSIAKKSWLAYLEYLIIWNNGL